MFKNRVNPVFVTIVMGLISVATPVLAATVEPEKSPVPTPPHLAVAAWADIKTSAETSYSTSTTDLCSELNYTPAVMDPTLPTETSSLASLCRGNYFGDCPSLRDKECWPICGRNKGYCILLFNCETQCNCTP